MKKFLALLFIFSFLVAQSPTSIGEYVVSKKSNYNPYDNDQPPTFKRFTVHYLEDEFRLTGEMDSISEFYCDSIGTDIPHWPVVLYPKADGTKLLGVVSDFYFAYLDTIYRRPFLEFDMLTPYDFSTITLDSTDAGIPKVSGSYGDYNFHIEERSEIKISNDGKHLFVVRTEDYYGLPSPKTYAEIYELNTPWTFMDGFVDSTYQSRFQISGDCATITGNGEYIIVKGDRFNRLENYRLTTPFDLDSRELIDIYDSMTMDGTPGNYPGFTPIRIQYHNDGEYFSFYRMTDSSYPNDFYFFRLETHGNIGTAKLVSRSSPYHDHYYIPTDTSSGLQGNISPGFYSTTINPNNIEKQPLDTELSLEVFDSDSDLVDIVFSWNGEEEIDGWDVDTDYRSLDGWTYSNWTANSSYQLNGGYSSSSDIEGENNTLAYIEKDIVLDYPGKLSFDWEVRSEVGDTGRFILDDVTELEWTGLLDDEPDPYSGSFSLAAGTHTIRWEYEKDEGGPSTAGYDRLILSNIEVDYEINIPTDTVYNVGMDSLVNGSFIDFDYGRNYTWLAEIMDGTDTTTTPDFTFKTKPQLFNHLPTTWNRSPDSNATGISVDPTLYIDINDQDNDTCIVTFFNFADSTIIDSDTITGTYHTAGASVTWSDLDYETEYTWYASVEDVRDILYTSTYNFTTGERSDSNLVAYWPLNGNSLDKSGNGRDLYNWSPATNIFVDGGIHGKYLQCDDYDEHRGLIAFDPFNLADTDEFTFCCTWTAAGSRSRFALMSNQVNSVGDEEHGSFRIYKYDAATGAEFRFFITNNNGETQLVSVSYDSYFSEDNTYHIVCTGDTDSLYIYIDGLKVASEEFIGTGFCDLNNPLILNALYRKDTRRFYNSWDNGYEDVSIWNNKFSAAEVGRFYNDGASIELDTTDNYTLPILGDSVIAHWSLDSSLVDSVGDYTLIRSGGSWENGAIGKAWECEYSGFQLPEDHHLKTNKPLPIKSKNVTIGLWMYAHSTADPDYFHSMFIGDPSTTNNITLGWGSGGNVKLESGWDWSMSLYYDYTDLNLGVWKYYLYDISDNVERSMLWNIDGIKTNWSGFFDTDSSINIAQDTVFFGNLPSLNKALLGRIDDITIWNRRLDYREKQYVMDNIISNNESVYKYFDGYPDTSTDTSESEVLLDSGLVSYYSLNGNSNDLAGDNDGTDRNITYTGSFINGDLCAGFSGDSDINLGDLDIPDPGSPSMVSENISISAWIKTSNNLEDQWVICRDYTFAHGKCQYSLNSSTDIDPFNGGHIIYDGAWRGSGVSTDVSDGNWHHLVGIQTPDSILYFIDGSLDSYTRYSGGVSGSGTHTVEWNNNDTYFGTYYHDEAYFQGQIAHSGFWNRKLNRNEIQALYNDGSGLFYPFGTTTPTSVEYLIIPSGVSFEDLIKFYNLDIDSIQSRSGVDIRE